MNTLSNQKPKPLRGSNRDWSPVTDEPTYNEREEMRKRTRKAQPRTNGKWTSSEVQGNGRRYWFATKEAARELAADRKAKGYVVLDDEESWDDPDCGPSVWVSKGKKETAETRAYQNGVDTISGLFT